MASGPGKMVVGFNHNIKHAGKLYHVQTEDSGLDNPHVITHLFVGGNIIASKKTSYADIAGADNLPEVVRELMEEQHKEMLRNLINGVYDRDPEGAAAGARVYAPGAPPPPGSAPRAASPPLPAPAAAPAPRPAPAAAPPAPAGPGPRGAPAPAARGAPPPPRAPAPAAAAGRPPAAPPRPAEPRAPARDDAQAGFGEDLISEKSLDEVILSYLAEDMGERKR